MNDTEAMRILSPLVAATAGWDDPKVELWVHKLGGLANPAWAAEAIDQVIDTHTTLGAPPWAKLYEAYQAIARRREIHQLSFPVGRGMPLDDYIATVKVRAAGGSREAQAELERWERLARAPRRSSDETATPNWIAVLEIR